MKYFRMSYEEVVFKRSYLNIMLLNRSIPSFGLDKDDEKPSYSVKSEYRTNGRGYRNESELFGSLM